MQIKLAENYGFCFGVKRAIKIAEENSGSSTYGPLIHNAKEIERLKADFNVSLKENLEAFEKGELAVIRTHGIPKHELEALQNNQVDVIDATCPYVTKPQQICEEMSAQGYAIVIFGDESHPEIKGVKSYAQNGAYVVLKEEELYDKHLPEKIAVVSQTTKKVEEFLKVCNYLVQNYKEVRVFNTICNATFENQDAVKKLAQESDVMIIIGGKNSSNTKQLFAIAKTSCADTFHIEDVNDIDFSWFDNHLVCGISAGASTPDWLITQVKDAIEHHIRATA